MGKEYEHAISFHELYRGLQKSQRNVMWKDSVAGYSINGLKNTYKLRQSLLNGTYKISQYQRFKIYEPKKRDILATRIQDRQYQRSICDNILYPQTTKRYIRDNCACQKGKGVDDALDRLAIHLRRYFRKNKTSDGWVLQCDIQKFFPSTQHVVAQKALCKAIEDEEAVASSCVIIESFCAPLIEDKLIEFGVKEENAGKIAYSLALERMKVIDAKIKTPSEVDEIIMVSHKKMKDLLLKTDLTLENQELVFEWITRETFSGIGLGSQVSQITELSVLNGLDHFIKERLHIKHYVRYMDDFLLIHNDKKYLSYCYDEIKHYVETLNLALNKKSGIYRISQGVKFLKWRYILTNTGKVVRKMNKKSIIKQRRKMRKFKEKLETGEITMKAVQDNFRSWCANAERGNTKAMIHKMRKYYYELYKEVAPYGNCSKKRRTVTKDGKDFREYSSGITRCTRKSFC